MNQLKLRHAVRLFSQHFQNSKISILGGYHGSNLGDMALGSAVAEALVKRKLKGVMQTIYSIDTAPWKKMPYAIIGGGAVGYCPSLQRIANRYTESEYGRIAFLGVDFNEKHYKSIAILEMLKKVKWISCRSINQAKHLENITGRHDIKVHPDLVFSLNTEYCRKKRKNKNREKRFLLNVVPLYGNLINGKMEKDLLYANERPELYENYDIMVKSYWRGVRLLALDALEKGYRLESVSFTPGDEIIARALLQKMPVKHHKYTDKPMDMIRIFSDAEAIMATRYHSTIYAIKLGLSIFPMAYAYKNEYLFEDLGIERGNFLTAGDLANGKFHFPDPILIEEEKILNWEDNCTRVMEECIDSLFSLTLD